MIGHKGKPRSIEIRFWEKVEKTESCWNWIGATDSVGYGNLRISGKTYRSHVLSYLINIGEIPKGLCVLHKCDNRKCVNPDHLFLGTKKDNTADMWQKGRANIAHGERSGRAQLTEREVIEIRKLHNQGKSTRDLASQFNISHSGIWWIVSRKSWKHVE